MLIRTTIIHQTQCHCWRWSTGISNKTHGLIYSCFNELLPLQMSNSRRTSLCVCGESRCVKHFVIWIITLLKIAYRLSEKHKVKVLLDIYIRNFESSNLTVWYHIQNSRFFAVYIILVSTLHRCQIPESHEININVIERWKSTEHTQLKCSIYVPNKNTVRALHTPSIFQLGFSFSFETYRNDDACCDCVYDRWYFTLLISKIVCAHKLRHYKVVKNLNYARPVILGLVVNNAIIDFHSRLGRDPVSYTLKIGRWFAIIWILDGDLLCVYFVPIWKWTRIRSAQIVRLSEWVWCVQAQWMHLIQLQWISGDILNAKMHRFCGVVWQTKTLRTYSGLWIVVFYTYIYIYRRCESSTHSFVKDCHEKIFSSTIHLYIYFQPRKKT